MGDHNTAHDDDVDTTDEGADDGQESKTEDDADTSQKTDANDAAEDGDDDGSDADDDADADAEDDKSDDSKGNSDKKKSSDTADDDDAEGDEDDGEEPTSRRPKTNAEWAAKRVASKGAKKDAAKGKSKDDAGSDDKDDDGEDTDDELSPEDAAAIDKRIAKHLEPITKKAAEQEVETEIASFLQKNPDFKPYAAKAKRWALHPSRKDVPVKSIFYEIAGDKLLTIGAKRRAEADAKARKTRTGGGSAAGNETGNKSYKDMPLEDFGKELDAVKASPRR